jgi:hypothetical protein
VAPGGVRFHAYGSEKSYSAFEWWNHWPVAQIPSSGRPSVAADRASHSSLSDIYCSDYALTDHTETKLLMSGLTPSKPEALVPIAKAWLSPPIINASGAGVQGAEYDPAQRAFVIHRGAGMGTSKVVLSMQANADKPIVNPG